MIKTSAEATLTLSGLAQTYDGTPKAATVTTAPEGLSGVSVTYNGSATVPTDAGSYAVVATLTNANYRTTNVTGTLIINPTSITVTADGQTKVFGDVDLALTYHVTSGSLVASDTFTGRLIRETGENIGEYAVKQGTLALNGNYSLTFAGANLTITPPTHGYGRRQEQGLRRRRSGADLPDHQRLAGPPTPLPPF